jgi:hypothetical protein
MSDALVTSLVRILENLTGDVSVRMTRMETKMTQHFDDLKAAIASTTSLEDAVASKLDALKALIDQMQTAIDEGVSPADLVPLIDALSAGASNLQSHADAVTVDRAP